MKSAHSKSPQCFKGKKFEKRTNTNNQTVEWGERMERKKSQAWPDLIAEDTGKKIPVGLRTQKIELLVRYRRYKVENISE